MNNLILQLCPGYFQTSLYENLFTVLNQKGLEQIVYVPDKKNAKTYSSLNVMIEVSSKSYTILQRLFFFGKQKDIFQDITQKEYFSTIKVIHAHTLFSSGYAAYKIFQKYGIPYIVAIRNTDVNLFLKYMIHLRKIGVKILNNAEKVVFISPSYKAKVLKKYIPNSLVNSIKKKSIVIPNGINPLFLDNINTNKVLNGNINNIKLIYIGEITINKNIETTIKACSELISQGYSVNLDVIGENKNKRIVKKIKKYNFIKYYPKCNQREVLGYLRKSDVFVMPSIYETFGLVYAEALSQGLPIIYTKGQGFDGFFEQGEVGYAVNKYDYKSIANYILAIYRDYEKISKTCVNAVKQFDWFEISNLYIQIYKEVNKGTIRKTQNMEFYY